MGIKKVKESGIEYQVSKDDYKYGSGNTYWYYRDKLHRIDDYAVEYPNGTKAWYLNGELIYSDGYDFTGNFDISDKMKLSIIKYKLIRE